MKRFSILFIIGIFLLAVARYFSINFSPFNLLQVQKLIEANNIKPGEWDLLNQTIQILIEKNQILNYLSANAYIAYGVLISGIFCIFISLHLLLDKFFFKNFYEKASIFDALRRGFLFCLAITLSIYLRLYGLDIQTIILINILILILEILFFLYVKSHIKHGFGRLIEFNKKVNAQPSTNKNL